LYIKYNKVDMERNIIQPFVLFCFLVRNNEIKSKKYENTLFKIMQYARKTKALGKRIFKLLHTKET
jgi:hypothetical protein